MVTTLIVAGAFAFIAGLSTWAVVRLQRLEISKAAIELGEYKLSVDGKVADAKKEGIEAGKAAGDALLRAASLEKQAAELRAANLVLEGKLKPRRISGEDFEKMLPTLSKFAASLPERPGLIKLVIGIVSRMGDPDSIDFANDFVGLLKASGWSPVRIYNWTGADRGVFIATRSGTPLPTEVEVALKVALEAADIKTKTISIPDNEAGQIPPSFQPNALYLIVGAKP